MSARSKREHKPTSKFLNYYIQEISSLNNGVQKIKKQPAKSTTAPSTKRPIVRKKVPIKSEPQLSVRLDIMSPEDINNLNSSSIRKSSRQHKPNQKLKHFLKQSLDNHDNNTPQTPSTSDLPKKTIRSLGAKRISKKCVATVSPMIRKEGIKTPIRCPKHITVGLVDCFEGLTNDLAQIYPDSVRVKEEPEGNSTRPPSAVEMGVDDDGRAKKRGRKKRSSVDQKPDDVRGGASSSSSSSSGKRKREAPSLVRNLTKMKKTKITTVVETVGLDVQQRKRTVVQNRKSRLTKQYPVPKPPSSSSEEEEEEDTDSVSAPASPPTSSSSSPLRPRNTLTPPLNPPQKSSTKPASNRLQKRDSTQGQEPHQKDIRETLKKFLIMGTKVANAISETLKHNEEALLSKSSAFEKKCLSLVHALAKQGADLEEDDMEKVLKLLDEEQEERKVYRHTFLESLRVSHLTNMALYSQMLRLLKTL